MILSSTAEFTPWVIQPKKDNQFSELTVLSKSINLRKTHDEVELNVSENITPMRSMMVNNSMALPFMMMKLVCLRTIRR